jgi:hypothetical protein
MRLGLKLLNFCFVFHHFKNAPHILPRHQLKRNQNFLFKCLFLGSFDGGFDGFSALLFCLIQRVLSGECKSGPDSLNTPKS